MPKTKTNKNSEQTRIDHVLRKIYITKYCRINAYKRTKSWDNYFQFLLFVSSLLILCVSILSLTFQNDFITFGIIFLSLVSFSSGLFIATKSYSTQSEEFKRCYNELEKLEAKLRKDPACIDVIEVLFEELITFSRNHDEQDNFRLKYEHYEDKVIQNEDEKNGKTKEYWRKKYFKSLAKDYTVKIILSFGIYLIVILICSLVQGVMNLFACKR